MNNPFTLEFKLRQHTPMIHFQWHEKNATIRPTELKAKLDKWIIGHQGLAEARIDKALKDDTLRKWLRGAKKKDKSNPALNYSVKVVAVGDNILKNELDTKIEEFQRGGQTIKKIVGKEYPPYFGNQLKIQDFKTGDERIKRLSYHKGVIVTFSSPYTDLINKIEQQFPEFILKTNFGTRQGKGFGSFFIERGTDGYPQNHEIFFNEQFDWNFDVKVQGNTDTDRISILFEKIDLFYKTLRSGISPHDRGSMYFKSLMWKYAKGQTRQWDKKTIKQTHFSREESWQQVVHIDTDSPINWNSGLKVIMPKPTVQKPNASEEAHLIWRDILGLSSQQTWMSYNSASVNKSHLEKYSPNGLKDKIARFKSPLFFKPIRTALNTFRVFFEVPRYIKDAFRENGVRTNIEEAQILGEWFDISGSLKSLELPFPNHFNFDEFLEESFAVNPSDYVKDGEEIFTHRDGRSESIPKRHGSTFSISKFNGGLGRNEWVEAHEYNPALDFLTKVFSELAKQAKTKTSTRL